MAESLKDFLISIGFAVDTSSQANAEAAVKRSEANVTKALEEEGSKRMSREEFRRQLAASGNNDLSKVKIETEKKTSAAVTKVAVDTAEKQGKVDIEARKKGRERREADFKDLSKHAVQFEALAIKVAGLAAGVGSALTATGFVRDVIGTASSYSRLAMESLRTRSAPQQIKAVTYGLSQLGVDAGEADSSLQNFSKYLQQNPGTKAILEKAGIDTSGSPAQIFAQLGKYFSTLRPAVALAAAGRMGVSQDAELGLQNPAYAGKVREGYEKFSNAGELAEEGRKTTAAYDRLAADLTAIKDKMEGQFFGPMADGFDRVSKAMEKNPEAADKMGKALLAFLTLMTARFIPGAKILTGVVGGLAAAFLAATTGPANAGEPQVSPDGTLKYPDGHTEKAQRWNGKSGGAGQEHGASVRDAARADRRTWWQRHAPKALGGKDAPGGRSSSATADRNMPVEGRALLDTIAGTESPGYNIEYGGSKFSGYGDHPRNRHVITSGPNAGRTSDAAGRYQFLSRTWDDIAGRYGLKDFSPESQDKAAWYLAQEEYKRKTGRALGDDLKSKDPGVIGGVGRALRGQWTSLPGGIEAGTNADRFAKAFDKNKQAEAAQSKPAGSPAMPSGLARVLGIDPASAAEGKPSPFGRLDPNAFKKSPFGGLDPNAFKTHPLGVSPGQQSTITNQTRGDSNFNQNVTINANGTASPAAISDALKIQARRGGQDMIRLTEGSTQ